MTAFSLPTIENADDMLRVEIVVSAPGLRVFVEPRDYPSYQADPIAYIAKSYRSTSQQVRRYIASGGTIQCMHIRSNRKQCRNLLGAAPGQIELRDWLQLDASGWYCHRHAE